MQLQVSYNSSPLGLMVSVGRVSGWWWASNGRCHRGQISTGGWGVGWGRGLYLPICLASCSGVIGGSIFGVGGSREGCWIERRRCHRQALPGRACKSLPHIWMEISSRRDIYYHCPLSLEEWLWEVLWCFLGLDPIYIRTRHSPLLQNPFSLLPYCIVKRNEWSCCWLCRRAFGLSPWPWAGSFSPCFLVGNDYGESFWPKWPHIWCQIIF